MTRPWYHIAPYEAAFVAAWLTVIALATGFPHGAYEWAASAAGWAAGIFIAKAVLSRWRRRS